MDDELGLAAATAWSWRSPATTATCCASFGDLGVPVLGVEPAANVAEIARGRGVETLTAFFGHETAAEQVVASTATPGWSPPTTSWPTCRTSTTSSEGFATLCDDRTVVTVENPSFVTLLAETQFDTIYHEHYSYLSAHAVARLVAEHGLELVDVEDLPTHGGSYRYTIVRHGRRAVAPTVAAAIGRGARRRAARARDLASDFAAAQPGDDRRRCGTGSTAAPSRRRPGRGLRRRRQGQHPAQRCRRRAATTSSSSPTAAPRSRAATCPAAGCPSSRPPSWPAPAPTDVLILPWNIAAEIAPDRRRSRARAHGLDRRAGDASAGLMAAEPLGLRRRRPARPEVHADDRGTSTGSSTTERARAAGARRRRRRRSPSRPTAAPARSAGCTTRWPRTTEAKTLWCTHGSVFDVLVDLRPDRTDVRQLGWPLSSARRPVALHVPAGRGARLPDARGRQRAHLPHQRALPPGERADAALGRPDRRHRLAAAGLGHLRAGPGGTAVAARVLITGATGLIGSQLLAGTGRSTVAAVPVGRGEATCWRPAPPRPSSRRPTRRRRAPGLDRERHRRTIAPTGDNARWVAATLELAEACAAAGAALVATGTAVDDDRDAADAYTAGQGRAPSRTGRRDRRRHDQLGAAVLRGRRRPRRPALVAQARGRAAARRGAAPAQPRSRHDFVHAEDVGRAMPWP